MRVFLHKMEIYSLVALQPHFFRKAADFNFPRVGPLLMVIGELMKDERHAALRSVLTYSILYVAESQTAHYTHSVSLRQPSRIFEAVSKKCLAICIGPSIQITLASPALARHG